MAMGDAKSTRWNWRRFTRVSLGALLLVVLLIGNAATTWWRWSPWALKSTFGSGGDKAHVALFANDKIIAMTDRGTFRDENACFYTDSGVKLDLPQVQQLSPDGQWALAFSYDAKRTDLIHVVDRKTKIIIEGHEQAIQSCFSSDSSRLLIVRPDNAIQCWKVDAAAPAFTTEPGFIKIQKIEFTPDSKYVCALGFDGRLRVWDAESGKLCNHAHAPDVRFQFVVVSPDSTCLLAACSDASARLFRLPDVVQITQIVCDDEIYAAAFSPDSQLVAVSMWSGTVEIIGRAKRDSLEVLKTSGVRTNGMAFSPDGLQLLTGGIDAAAYLWNMSGIQILHLPGLPNRNSYFPPVVFDAVAKDENPEIADVPDVPATPAESAWGKEVARGSSAHSEQIARVRFVANGAVLATTSVDGSVGLWDAKSGERIECGTNGLIAAVSDDGTKVTIRNTEAKRFEWWERRRDPSISRIVAQPEIWLGALILILLAVNLYRTLRGRR